MNSLLELAPEFQLTWFDWTLALIATFLLGVAKAGLKGIGVVIVTLMAIVFGGKASTGIILPLLTAGDILAVIYYNRHAQWKYLRRLLPWMAVGVLLGVWAGKDMPEEIFKRGMAIIILLTVVMMYYWDRRKSQVVPDNQLFAGVMGLSAGFTTMVGNLAGAFANIFFLAMRLPKDQFIGTAAWLFFLINLFKWPFHIFSWGTIDKDSLVLDLWLLPAIVVGFWAGVKLVKIIKEHHYRQLILLLTAFGAVMIFFR